MLKRRPDSELGRIYEPGQPIVVQGEWGDTMFVIQSGKVEVIATMDGRDVRLMTMGPGDFFGEMALFQSEPRAATVRAVGRVRAVTVDRRTLLRKLQEDPSLAYGLVESMAQRLRSLQERIHEAMGREVDR